MFIPFLLAAVCFSVLSALAGKAPLGLAGKKRRWFLVAAGVVLLLSAAAFALRQTAPISQLSYFFLVSCLCLLAATDYLEFSVYDLHFRVLLLGGIAGAFLTSGLGFIAALVRFAVLYGLLLLLARKNPQLSVGDSQVIAALSLYFPLARWTEIILLALFAALLYGIARILVKQASFRSEIPFMPFLLTGVVIEYFL